MSKDITTYAAFWPYYLREHSKASTRGWHYFGTSLALGLLGYAIVSGRWGLIVAAFISGYFFAWISHGAFEKNKPATFTYPLWSLFSDFKMLFCFLTGRMSAELKAAGIES